MNVRLISKISSKNDLLLLLSKYNIDVSDQSQIWLIEDGTINLVEKPLPIDVLSIHFSLDTLGQLEQVLSGLGHLHIQDKVIAQSDDRMIIIKLSDVLYFEAHSGHVFCHTKDDEFMMKERLYEIEKNLIGAHFIRINKSMIANADNISEIIPWFNRRLLLKFENATKQCEVSKNHLQSFKQFLGIRR